MHRPRDGQLGRIMLGTQNSNQAGGNFHDTAETVFYTRNCTVPAWTNKLRGTADAKAAPFVVHRTSKRPAAPELPPKTSDAGASCAWAYSTRDAVDHQMRISTARLRVLILRAYAWENEIVGCDPQAVHRLLGRAPPVKSASATTKCSVLCHCCASQDRNNDVMGARGPASEPRPETDG